MNGDDSRNEKKYHCGRNTDWRRRANIAQTIVAAGAVAAAVIAAFEYNRQKETARAEQTISYVELWETGGYQADWRKLRSEWNDYLSRVPDNQQAAAKGNPDRERRLIEMFLSTAGASKLSKQSGASENSDAHTEKSRLKALHNLTYFFNRLHLCVEAGLCSPTVTKTFFGGQIGSFIDTFEPWLQTSESGNGGRLRGLRSLAE